MRWSVEIRIDSPFQAQVQEDWLRQAIEATLGSEEFGHSVELSLLVTGDEIVQELNRDYRGIDRTTDVLSFAFQEGADSSFPPSANGVFHLGEVIISCPQAAKQAMEQSHSLRRELTILTIHGVLHLLGYEHQRPQEEGKMRFKENEILAILSHQEQYGSI